MNAPQAAAAAARPDAGDRPHAPGAAGDAPEKEGEPRADRPDAVEEAEDREEGDEPIGTWAARRELYAHSPGIVLGSAARLGGSVVGGSQHGVSGGQVLGDVVMGGKTEVHQVGPGLPARESGKVTAAALDRLAAVFVAGGGPGDAAPTPFETALARLRSDRVVVLSGVPATGRRAAALMLLRHLGATPVHTLDPGLAPSEVAAQLSLDGGYLLADPDTSTERPLREHDLDTARGRLAATAGGHLVITVGVDAYLHDVPTVPWSPPAPDAVLRAHLESLVGAEASATLLALPVVRSVLARQPRLHEVAEFARTLAEHHRGDLALDEVERFDLGTVGRQVRRWFDDARTPLRDKAFLVSLAAFDAVPYALTAEVADRLYVSLQAVEDPEAPPRIPVFSTSVAKRLELARARSYREQEETRWGPVPQTMAAFRDERTALVLLDEVWTGHPSARPALVGWLRQLANDHRSLVRTRAAATAAVLARSDLPSAMGLLIGGWAAAHRYRYRVAAATAVTLAHLLQTPNIPNVVREWSRATHTGLRWTAVRAYGLLGEHLPQSCVEALLDMVRGHHPGDRAGLREAGDVRDSLAVLLLSAAGGTVLRALAAAVVERGQVADTVLDAFLSAARGLPEEGPAAAPVRAPLLDWFAASAAGGDGADHHLAALWRAALGDRAHSAAALEVLRGWVRAAESDPVGETALAAMLPRLIATTADHQRLSHLLRTADAGGTARRGAAHRLHTYLTQR